VVDFLLALVPSAGVLLLFWIVIKGMVEADRRERIAQARLERAQDKAAAERTSGGTAAAKDIDGV
jgi:hypothetical protein